MRISTDDQAFGVIITAPSAALDDRFFRFQLVVSGEIIGSAEPSIIGSAIHFLQHVTQVEDARLADPETDPDGAIATALGESSIHDRVVFSHAESLDSCQVVAYEHGAEVMWLARTYGSKHERTVIARVTAADYDEVVRQVAAYWTAHSAR